MDPTNAGYCLNQLSMRFKESKKGTPSAWTEPVGKLRFAVADSSPSQDIQNFERFFGLPEVVMMLASTDCRVALVTTHLPLAESPRPLP